MSTTVSTRSTIDYSMLVDEVVTQFGSISATIISSSEDTETSPEPAKRKRLRASNEDSEKKGGKGNTRVSRRDSLNEKPLGLDNLRLCVEAEKIADAIPESVAIVVQTPTKFCRFRSPSDTQLSHFIPNYHKTTVLKENANRIQQLLKPRLSALKKSASESGMMNNDLIKIDITPIKLIPPSPAPSKRSAHKRKRNNKSSK